MGIISGLADNRKEDLSNDIENLSRQIREYREAYESLKRFRTAVSNSQGDFNTANTHRRTLLKDLDPVRADNTVVQKYQRSMGDQLTGIGMQVVDVAFIGLQGMITLKLTEYWNMIQLLEADKKAKEIEKGAINIII